MSTKFELELLKKIVPTFATNSNLIVPIGDDCAGVELNNNSSKLLLIASDQLIGNVHYFEENTTPQLAGAKLLKRNLSDIASMGGRPLYALLNIANGNFDVDYLTEFVVGINQVANQYNTLIIGGDIGHFQSSNLASDSHLVTSLTIIGEVEKSRVALRKNAKEDDYIFVTGSLGESLKNNHHLNFQPRLAEGQFLVDNNLTNCMMDISDGLLIDLKRICSASNISAKIQIKNLPLRNNELHYSQINDGEDYELIFAVSSKNRQKLLDLWQDNFAPITEIGRFFKSDKIEILDDNSQEIKLDRMGYEH